jgi:hypothetical protein
MKKNKILLLGLFCIFIAGFFLAGCPQEGGGNNVVSTISTPSLKGVPDFTGTPVASLAEAITLFNSANIEEFVNALVIGDRAVFNAARVVKYPTPADMGAFMAAEMAKKKSSLSVTINNVPLAAIDGQTVTGTITGKNTASWSTNRASLGSTASFAKKDKGSESIEATRTISITGGNINTGSSIVAGNVKTEYKSSSSFTVTDIISGGAIIFNGSWSYISKCSMAISVTANGKGAKFVFSVASDAIGARAATGSGTSKYSDIAVYNNNNKKIFTIPAGAVEPRNYGYAFDYFGGYYNPFDDD